MYIKVTIKSKTGKAFILQGCAKDFMAEFDSMLKT